MFQWTKEVVWIKKFINKLGVVPSIVDLVALYCNNNIAITQIKNQGLINDLKIYLNNFILLENHIEEKM
jgi:hypothetical protein